MNITKQKRVPPLVIMSLIAFLAVLTGFALYALFFLNTTIPEQPLLVDYSEISSQDDERSGKAVYIDVTLSSISLPKGKIDILWDIVIPEEEQQKKEDSSLHFPAGYMHAIAEPLHLIEKFKIVNNTDESIFIESIKNEQTEHIQTPPRPGTKATPMMLLPAVFFGDDGQEHPCVNRDIDERLGLFSATRELSGLKEKMNNVCVFESPIEVLPGEILVLAPEIYATGQTVHSGVVERNVFRRTEDVFFELGSRWFIEANMNMFDGDVWLVPSLFEEYDDVAEIDTFNLGGFIIIDVEDEALINDIFVIKSSNGDDVNTIVREVDRGFTMVSYEIPSLPFEIQDGFDSNVLGMQIFFYVNRLWDKKSINGFYDETTEIMVREFQKSANIAETGKFDDATMLIARSRNFKGAELHWMATGESFLAIDEKTDTFFYFGDWFPWPFLHNNPPGGGVVDYLEIAADCLGAPSNWHCIGGHDSGGGNVFPLQPHVYIVNNTNNRLECFLNDVTEEAERFLVEPNEMYFLSKKISEVEIVSLREIDCGTAKLFVQVKLEE